MFSLFEEEKKFNENRLSNKRRFVLNGVETLFHLNFNDLFIFNHRGAKNKQGVSSNRISGDKFSDADRVFPALYQDPGEH